LVAKNAGSVTGLCLVAKKAGSVAGLCAQAWDAIHIVAVKIVPVKNKSARRFMVYFLLPLTLLWV
jgi:hypothetical protein